MRRRAGRGRLAVQCVRARVRVAHSARVNVRGLAASASASSAAAFNALVCKYRFHCMRPYAPPKMASTANTTSRSLKPMPMASSVSVNIALWLRGRSVQKNLAEVSKEGGLVHSSIQPFTSNVCSSKHTRHCTARASPDPQATPNGHSTRRWHRRSLYSSKPHACRP